MSKKRKPNYFIPVAIVAGLGLAVYTSSRTWKMAMQEKEKATSMRSELDATQRSNAKLKAKEQLLNPVQKEEEARRMGYVLPNEVPLTDKGSNTPVTEELKKSLPKNDTATQPMDLREEDKDQDGAKTGQ